MPITRGSPSRVLEPASRIASPVEVTALAVSPDGGQLVVGGMDGSLRRYRVPSGEPAGELPAQGGLVAALSFAGERVVSAADAVVLFDPAGASPRRFAAEGARFRRACVAGTTLIGITDSCAAYLWDEGTGELRRRMPLWGYADAASDAVPSPDGALIVSVDRDYTMTLWSSQTGEEAGQLEGYEFPVSAIAFTPDSKRLLSAHVNATVALWSLVEGAQNAEYRLAVGMTSDEIEEDGYPLPGLAVSPDGKRALVALAEGPLRLIDVDGGRAICELRGHETPPAALAFGPDGTWAISGGEKQLLLWTLQ